MRLCLLEINARATIFIKSHQCGFLNRTQTMTTSLNEHDYTAGEKQEGPPFSQRTMDKNWECLEWGYNGLLQDFPNGYPAPSGQPISPEIHIDNIIQTDQCVCVCVVSHI